MEQASVEQLQSKLLEIFRDQLAIEVADTESDLVKAGQLDSLAFVELLFQIEETFDVTIAVDALEIDQFRSVRSISEFVSQKLAG